VTEEVNRILADAHTAAALLACLEQTPVATTAPGPRSRRCGGTSRSLPR